MHLLDKTNMITFLLNILMEEVQSLYYTVAFSGFYLILKKALFIFFYFKQEFHSRFFALNPHPLPRR